jgi:hypothetical protein
MVNPEDLKILLRARPERATRALRWLRKARDNPGTIDEFICFIIALESTSHLLGKGGTAYTRCPRCQQDIAVCPQCGKGTERPKPGADILRDYATGILGWSAGEWKEMWRIRNALLHGEGDVIEAEPYALLEKLEFATVSALKIVLNLSAGHAPKELGLRGLMVGAGNRELSMPPTNAVQETGSKA